MVTRNKNNALRKRNLSRKILIKKLFGGDISDTLDGPIIFTRPDEPIASGTTKKVYSLKKIIDIEDMLLIEVKFKKPKSKAEYNGIHLEYMILQQTQKLEPKVGSEIKVSNWTEYTKNGNIYMIRYLVETCPLNLANANISLFLKDYLRDKSNYQLKAYFDKLMTLAIFKLPMGIEYKNYSINMAYIYENQFYHHESTLVENTTVLNVDCKPPNFCYSNNNAGELEVKKLDIGVEFLIRVDPDIDTTDSIRENEGSSVNEGNTEFVNEKIAKCYVFLLNCMYIHIYSGGDGVTFKNTMKRISHYYYVTEENITQMLKHKLLNFMLTLYFEENVRKIHNTSLENYITWFIKTPSPDGSKFPLILDGSIPKVKRRLRESLLASGNFSRSPSATARSTPQSPPGSLPPD